MYYFDSELNLQGKHKLLPSTHFVANLSLVFILNAHLNFATVLDQEGIFITQIHPTGGQLVTDLYVDGKKHFYAVKKIRGVSSIVVYEVEEQMKQVYAASSPFFDRLFDDSENVVFLEGGHFAHWNKEEKVLTVNDLRGETSKIIEFPDEIDEVGRVQLARASSHGENCLTLLSVGAGFLLEIKTAVY